MIARTRAILLFFLISLSLAAYFGGNILNIFLLMWISLGILAFLYYQMLPVGLPCSLEIPTTCAKGRKVTGYLHVKQEGLLPIFYGVAKLSLKSLYYQQEEVINLEITLMGREEGFAAFDLELPYAGMLEITLQKAEIYGLFGIGKKTILSSIKKSLTVMPDIREMKISFPNLGNLDSLGEELRDGVFGYDPGIYQGIHPYRLGDSLKNIHWKLTGKTEELMVKELGLPSGREPRLYLETGLSKMDPDEIDQRIEDYFSLSVELLHRGQPHILCWKNDGRLPQEYRIDSIFGLEMLMDPLFHIRFWKSEEERKGGIYYMSHDEKEIFMLRHEKEGDVLTRFLKKESLWKEGEGYNESKYRK